MSTISDIFAAQGVPSPVWEPIMLLESGGNAGAYTKTPIEESVGLFQLNRMGGLGAGYSVAQLKDPTFNASIAAAKMAPAYQQGVSKGLTGYALTQYVAYSSGWPTQAGVGALSYDKTVQAYEPKLLASYNSVTGQTLGPAVQTGAPAPGGSVGISSQLKTLQGTATASGGGWASEAGAIGLMVLIAVLGMIFLFVGLKLISGGAGTTIIEKGVGGNE